MVAEGRGLPVVALHRRALHPLHRVVADGVALAEVLEERGEGGEPVPLRHPGETTVRELIAPGDDVGAGDAPELERLLDPDEPHEVLERVLVGAGGRAAEVLEPTEVGAWARCTLCQARVQLAPPAPGRTRARIPEHAPAARPRKERLPNEQLRALLLAETGGLERARGGWRSIAHLSYPQRATREAVQQLRAAGALAEDGWKLVPTPRGRQLLSGYPPLVAT